MDHSNTQLLTEIPFQQVNIFDPFWKARLIMNAEKALFFQWEQLERTGTIDNFRIVAKIKEGFRAGMFYCDSDAFKWLEAAVLSLGSFPSNKLETLVDDFIAIIQKAQDPNGYLYTYHQFHFPGTRWVNQQIQHELYNIGHLIEAGVSDFIVRGKKILLEISIKAADLLVKELLHGTPFHVDGHEEIEIALIRLYRVTKNPSYLELAEAFLERRGHIPHLMWQLLRQGSKFANMEGQVKSQKEAYAKDHPNYSFIKLPPGVYVHKNLSQILRMVILFGNGKYFQHKPIRSLLKPEGHSVRYTYLATAMALLYQENGDKSLIETLSRAWDVMVARRMYITGGLGALPTIEGFGYDYELPNNDAYAETCAALGSIFWNWQMLLITQEPKYADLLEWQLYNAASSGIAYEGNMYLYRNPLESEGKLKREGWFHTPCCPSNVSRTWAVLGKYLTSVHEDELFIHQYIGSQLSLKDHGYVVKIECNLPWSGKISIDITQNASSKNPLSSVSLRIPHWATHYTLILDGNIISPLPMPTHDPEPLACAFSPYNAFYHHLDLSAQSHHTIELNFSLKSTVHHAINQVKADKGRIALSRGPLVYCLEGIDNENKDVRSFEIDLNTPITEQYTKSLFDGIYTLHGKLTTGQNFTAIPYFLWNNRGVSPMAVWIRAR